MLYSIWIYGMRIKILRDSTSLNKNKYILCRYKAKRAQEYEIYTQEDKKTAVYNNISNK